MAASAYVRTVSKAAFGNRHRLEVLAAIAAADKRFYQREVAAATQIPDSTVAPILQSLEKANLLRVIERIQANGPKFYERQESIIWTVAARLFAALDEGERASLDELQAGGANPEQG